MNYIAFDVGISNLSYCILDENEKIKEWDIIDLTNKLPEYTCTGLTKKGDLCGKNARYLEDPEKKTAYCNMHYKKVDVKVFPIVKDPICGFTEKCKSKIKYCIKDNCYDGVCNLHYKKCNQEEYREFTKPLPAAKLGKDIDKLTDRLFYRLDQYPSLLLVDHVGIENQPCMKQPLMKSIQIALYSYLKIRGKIDGICRIKSMRMINASEKCVKKSKNYAQRKKDSIEQCLETLGEDEESWKTHMKSHKKKDDLADSYNLCKVLIKKVNSES